MEHAPIAAAIAGLTLLFGCSSSKTAQEPGGDSGTSVDHTDVPGRQFVTFDLSNDTGSQRWIRTSGTICANLAIETSAGRQVQIGPYDAVCCNCGAVLAFVEYQPLAAAEHHTITWDAREFFEYETGDMCTPTSSYANPVSAGDYVARLQTLASPPMGSSCMPAANGGIRCQDCETATESKVPFTLPPTGDITVPVSLK